MVSKNLNLPLLFCFALLFPNVFACQKIFWEMPSRKAQCVERFLVHLWPLLGSFDYRRNLGHTYSATFSRLDCWTMGRLGWWFLVGRFLLIWGSIKRWPGKRKRTSPKQLRVDWESMVFCILWDSMPSMNIPNHRYPFPLAAGVLIEEV